LEEERGKHSAASAAPIRPRPLPRVVPHEAFEDEGEDDRRGASKIIAPDQKSTVSGKEDRKTKSLRSCRPNCNEQGGRRPRFAPPVAELGILWPVVMAGSLKAFECWTGRGDQLAVGKRGTIDEAHPPISRAAGLQPFRLAWK